MTLAETHTGGKFSKEEKMFIEKLFQAFDTDRSGTHHTHTHIHTHTHTLLRR